MLLIDNEVAAAVLSMDQVIAVLEESYRGVVTGDTICRPRIDMRFPTGTGDSIYQWGTMEGGSASSGLFAIRIKSDVLSEVEYEGVRTQEKYCVQPGTFCGFVLLFSTRTGEPLAVINDGVLQHMRVAADSAIGVKYAAKESARVLGMLGSGGMARTHVESLKLVRPIDKVQVYSPTVANRQRYAAEMAAHHGIEVVAVDRPEDVFRGADIVSGCTDAAGDVIVGDWIEPGTHVTSIGGGLDERARQVIDVWLRLGTCPPPRNYPDWRPTDEYLMYFARPEDPVWSQHTHGRIRRPPGADHQIRSVNFEEVVSKRVPVRQSDDEISFSERGNIQGAQFFAVAGLVWSLAKERGLGKELPTEWLLQDIRD